MTNAAHASQPPRTIACVKVDTLGDVVLFAPTLRAIRAALPTARLLVVVRRAYGDLGPLLVDGVEWITTTLDPFANGPEHDPAELGRVREQIAAAKPDVIIAATSRRTWLETVLAATSGAPRRIALGASAEDEFFATEVRVKLGIDTKSAFQEHVPIAAEEPDWQRNFAVADALLGAAVPRQPPRLRLPDEARGAGAAILAERQMAPGRYVVCAAAGFANVSLKTWPADRFAAALRHLRERHGLPALLIGNEAERAYLDALAASAGAGATVWTGGAGSLPQLAAVVANAALYLGNDTGAMHLAAALDVPVVAVFGGGTWPRFVPAARRAVSVVHPLPCFGCGWDCAFGDAPCIGEIAVDDVTRALDFALASRDRDFTEIRAVEHVSAATRAVMDKAAAQYRDARRDHLARQHKLEELTALDREKDAAIHEKEAEIDQKEAAIFEAEAEMKIKEKAIAEKQAEIDALKVVCDQREKLIFEIDRNARALQAQLTTVQADKALLEKTLAELPDDRGHAVRTIAGQASHIRNLEALVQIRTQELTEARASAANRAAGRHEVEQAKHYSRLLGEKEAVIRELHHTCEQREAVIRELTAKTTSIGGALYKLGYALRAYGREKIGRPLRQWLYATVVEHYWMQIGVLRQYAPRPLRWDDGLPGPRLPDAALPQVGIVTPSYGQEKFIERTLRSVLEQHYPKLRYAVQDGGSKDRSPEIIARHADRLAHWESVKDNGQADAIARGFAHLEAELGPNDIMAWLNSDDLFGPGVLRFVAEFFARNPGVDVLYGHRIIIDDDDREVGRWIMPRHDPATLEWIDYVPQETLFWRKKAWDLVGGIDPSFQFALDWDLLARFQQAGCKIVRVPYFLGAFRVHNEQKTTQVIDTTGADEMNRVRIRFHRERHNDQATIDQFVRHTRLWGALTARLHALGVRR